jgi:hypothetical protein
MTSSPIHRRQQLRRCIFSTAEQGDNLPAELYSRIVTGGAARIPHATAEIKRHRAIAGRLLRSREVNHIEELTRPGLCVTHRAGDGL